MAINAMSRLFGKSPFVPLQLHLDKVADCVEATGVLLDEISAGTIDDAGKSARVISKLEHKADLVKNEIRNIEQGRQTGNIKALNKQIIQLEYLISFIQMKQDMNIQKSYYIMILCYTIIVCYTIILYSQITYLIYCIN